MDNISIALSVSIAVVLVMLYNCWKSPNQRRAGRGCNRREGLSSGPAESDWGSGVQNKKFEQSTEELKDLVGYADYNSVMQYQALEPEVFESHKQYSKDMNKFNMGPSAMSETSHDNYAVPWVGLRRPDTHSVYADENARVVHSEYVDQTPKNRPFVIA